MRENHIINEGGFLSLEVQRKQMVSGGCLGEKTLLDALDGNIYNGDKGENMNFKKN